MAAPVPLGGCNSMAKAVGLGPSVFKPVLGPHGAFDMDCAKSNSAIMSVHLAKTMYEMFRAYATYSLPRSLPLQKCVGVGWRARAVRRQGAAGGRRLQGPGLFVEDFLHSRSPEPGALASVIGTKDYKTTKTGVCPRKISQVTKIRPTVKPPGKKYLQSSSGPSAKMPPPPC